MNIKKIESLIDQIENCPLVIVDDSPYLHSCEVLGQPENIEDEVILKFNWNDDEGNVFEVEFTEGNLDKANFKNNRILLKDSENNDCVIILYDLEPSPVVKNWE